MKLDESRFFHLGTKNDIKWFERILDRIPKIEVLEFSDMYLNKGTDKYYRVYVVPESVKFILFNSQPVQTGWLHDK